jgi:hypothetical protein
MSAFWAAVKGRRARLDAMTVLLAVYVPRRFVRLVPAEAEHGNASPGRSNVARAGQQRFTWALERPIPKGSARRESAAAPPTVVFPESCAELLVPELLFSSSKSSRLTRSNDFTVATFICQSSAISFDHNHRSQVIVAPASRRGSGGRVRSKTTSHRGPNPGLLSARLRSEQGDPPLSPRIPKRVFDESEVTGTSRAAMNWARDGGAEAAATTSFRIANR